MRRVIVLVGLVACGAAGTPTPAPRPPKPPTAAVPVRPKVRAEVVPGELGDPGVLERIPRRVYVHTIGRAWIRLDQEPVSPEQRDRPMDPVPVLAVTREHLRVVSDDDGARLAVWMLHKDASPAVVAPVQLTDADGVAARDAGVWLQPGVELEPRGPGGARRQMRIVDAQVRASGWLPAAAIGTVWTVAPVPAFAPTHQLAAGEIRAAPATAAPVIAETAEELDVEVGELRGDWRAIVVQHGGVRVRGFVPAAAVSGAAAGEWGSIAAGSFYTISHTVRVDVAAGVCLFDRIDGEVVGVNLQAKRRIGHAPEGDWQRVYIGTPWGTLLVYVHAASSGEHESCLP